MDVTGSRKAVVIHVPYRLRKAFRKIHVRLVRELEKKFSGKVNFSFFIFFYCCSWFRFIYANCSYYINMNGVMHLMAMRLHRFIQLLLL
jgi:hypothetical protein